jgi:hypothetical protein
MDGHVLACSTDVEAWEIPFVRRHQLNEERKQHDLARRSIFTNALALAAVVALAAIFAAVAFFSK